MADFVVAEQYLCGGKDFSMSNATLPVRRHKKIGEDTARITDLD